MPPDTLRKAIEQTENELRVCRYRMIRSPELERRQARLQERLESLEAQRRAAVWEAHGGLE